MKVPLLLATCSLVAATAIPVRAQKALFVKVGDSYHLVRKVEETTPYYDDGTGKLVAAHVTQLALAPAKEFLPVYVSIRDLRAGSRYVELLDSGSRINNEFHFNGSFESPYRLTNVFLVLDMNLEASGHTLFVHEIGNLEPRTPKPVNVTFALPSELGEGRYQVHLFADGPEVFNSMMPLGAMEADLDALVARRIAGVENAPPKPLIGPAPEYPAALRKKGVTGSASIHFTISARGRVLDPTVASATDPAFGEAALVAARQWRFLPRVKNGQPVSTPVTLPFNFGDPTPAPASKPGR